MTVINAILYFFIDWQHNINIIQMYSIYVFIYLLLLLLLKLI